ncbi:DNA-directed RNA polymerase sigma-70 factor [Allostella vacuolata]|nr:DNA-directed RNA polymerase sigma-70 factor [Stella vacuolata]
MTGWAARVAGLFSQHRASLEAFLSRRTGDPEAARDLAQDAFLRLARMPDGERVENPAGLLFTVADRIAIDHGRQAQRRRLRDAGPPDEAIPAPGPGAEALADRRQTFERLAGAIRALSPKARRIFLLYHVEGRSYREIADALGISPRTVEYHLRQALEHCRAHLKGPGT